MIVDGETYPIRTDYRAGVAYCVKLLSGGLTVQEFYNIWFPAGKPANLSAAQAAVNAFYRCGAEPKDENIPASAPAYAFTVDSEAIIAAFQREYGIDLTAEKLHWWRFSALLDGLLTHSFSERVQFRNCDPNEIKSKDLRARYRKFKQQYALDAHGEPRKEPKTLDEYNDMLLRQARGEL